MKIVFATGNKDKLREIREIMGDLGMEILSMKDAGVDDDIEENGNSFSENSMIKAESVANKLKEKKPELAKESIVMADDSGLEVDYLDKAPGIYSARYMGKDTSYSVKNAAIIEKLQGVEGAGRSARFVCAVSAVLPNGKKLGTLETMEGRIAESSAGANGFGYDPIFFLPQYNKTSAELTEQEKNAISHRGKAIRAMEKLLRKELLG